MKSSVMKQRFRAGTAVLVVLMLILSVFPSGTWVNREVKATNLKTIYFDTCAANPLWGEYNGWTKTGQVYIYLYGTSGNSGIQCMNNTDITSVGGSGYRVYSYDVDIDKYNMVIFISQSNWGDNTLKTLDATIAAGAVYRLVGDDSTPRKVTSHFEIQPSETGTGKYMFHTSNILKKNDSPSTNNVKHSGNNYYVGDYTYTGRYLTYRSDFFDYLSDEEVMNGWNKIADSKSSGYTDLYRTFNNRISGYTQSSADSSKKIILEFQGTNYGWNGLYVWGNDNSETEVLGNWGTVSDMFSYSKSGYTILYKDVKKVSKGQGTTTYENYYTLTIELDLNTLVGNSTAANITAINLINYYNDNNSQRITINDLKLGYRYIIQPYGSAEKYKCVLAEKLSVTKTTNNPYTYPLYFGCFFLTDYNKDYSNTQAALNNNSYKTQPYGYNQEPYYDNFYWPANISIREKTQTTDTANNANLSASVTGLVASELSENGGLMDAKKSNVELPYFNTTWADSNPDVVKKWQNIDFPFYEVKVSKDWNGNTLKDDNGESPIFYQFNSRDTASLYLDTTKNKLCEHSGQIMSQAATVGGATKGFYPFNEANTDGVSNNLGFGVKYTIPFVLTEDGKIKGVDTVFEFMGDDDVWVFIDGKLTLDMGGGHKDAYGKINFALGENQGAYLNRTATIADEDGNIQTLSQAADAAQSKTSALKFSGTAGGKDDDYKLNPNGDLVYNTSKVHTLTMYFMERGMWESDNFIRFNFIRQNILNVKNNIEVKNVNTGFVNKTYEAANYDVFDYTLENQIVRTRAEEVSSSGLPYFGGRSNAQRKVNSIDKTTTGMNSTVSEDAEGNYKSGNFIWNVFQQNIDEITEGTSKDKIPVWETYFQRYDDYMVIPGNDTGTKYVTGKTTGTSNADANGGHFELLYGQKASFVYQFYSDSLMYLVQNDSLNKLKNRITLSTIEDSRYGTSDRKASDLYKTTWWVYDIDQATLGKKDTDQKSTSGVYVNDNVLRTSADYDDFSDYNFKFQNKEPRDNVGVNITAEYTNEPRVGELKIKKQIVDATATGVVDEKDEYDGDFIINVKFTKIFGQTDDNGDSINLEKDDYTGKGEQKGVAYYVADKDGYLLDEGGNKIGDGIKNISDIPTGTQAALYMEYDDTAETGTIKIKRDQTVIIPNIPVYTEYTITESDQTYHKNYNLVVDDGTQSSHEITKSREKINGTIAEGTTQILNIVNNQRQLGDLVVEKVVANEGSNNTSLFEFEVTLENNYDDDKTYDNFSFAIFKDKLLAGNTVKTGELTVTDENVAKGGTTTKDRYITYDYDTSNNKITFTTKLKHGEKLTITNVPYGTKYTITEKSASDGGTYNIRHLVKYGEVTEDLVQQTETTTNVHGVLKSPTTTDTVTNIRMVALQIQKTFRAPADTVLTKGQTEVEFLVLRSTDGTNWEDAKNVWGTPESGTLTVKFDWSEDLTFDETGTSTKSGGVSGLPVCDKNGNYYRYKVVEYKKDTTNQLNSESEWATIDGKKYTVTYDTDQVVTVAANDKKNLHEFKVSNAREDAQAPVEPIVMPETGGDGSIYYLPIGITAIVLAGAALMIYKKRLQPVAIRNKQNGGVAKR